MEEKISSSDVQVYGYRWIVLLAFAIINIIIQIHWLTFAPIALAVQQYYGVSALGVDCFSIVYLAVFIILCIPSTYFINHYSLRASIGTAAVLVGICGLTKGLFAESYTLVMLSQFGLALSQPLVINAGTTVAVRWFPITERATATGVALLAQFVGIIIAMVVTPVLINTGSAGVYDIPGMLMFYGAASVICAAFLLMFLRSAPPTPPGKDQEERYNIIEGIGHMLKKKDMQLLMISFFIGLGIFNAVTTCIDQICKIKGLTFDQSGMIGGTFLISGVVGASLFPVISDKLRKRKAMFVPLIALALPGTVGLTFASSYTGMLASAAWVGFFALGASPITFQYSAEISTPAPEAASQGLLMLVGQIGGFIFVFGMNGMGMLPGMYLFIGLSVINIVLVSLLKESGMVQAS